MDTFLTTNRLSLPLVALKDLSEIHALHSLQEIDEFNTLGIPEDIGQTEQILKEWNGAAEREVFPEYVFAIREKGSTVFIGLIALKCGNPKFKIGEVWYKIHPDYWGKGYATEALERVLDFGFNGLLLHRIEAGCAIGNKASIRVLEKAGMWREGRKRKVLPLKSGWSDNFEFAILEEDWQAQMKPWK